MASKLSTIHCANPYFLLYYECRIWSLRLLLLQGEAWVNYSLGLVSPQVRGQVAIDSSFLFTSYVLDYIVFPIVGDFIDVKASDPICTRMF